MIELLSWLLGIITGMGMMLVILRVKHDLREALITKKLKKSMEVVKE